MNTSPPEPAFGADVKKRRQTKLFSKPNDSDSSYNTDDVISLSSDCETQDDSDCCESQELRYEDHPLWRRYEKVTDLFEEFADRSDIIANLIKELLEDPKGKDFHFLNQYKGCYEYIRKKVLKLNRRINYLENMFREEEELYQEHQVHANKIQLTCSEDLFPFTPELLSVAKTPPGAPTCERFESRNPQPVPYPSSSPTTPKILRERCPLLSPIRKKVKRCNAFIGTQ